MPLMQQSSVLMARAEDEVGSVTLTASVAPPEQAVNLKWTKSGEGFDISPKGTSCTVTGNDSFEGYDTSGTVKAELGPTETIVGSSDTCAITVVKDKGNLLDTGDFSTVTANGITIQRMIANKYLVSGTSDSTTFNANLGTISLQEGVYSLGRSDYSHLVTSGSGSIFSQIYSSVGGNLFRSGNGALVDGDYRVNLISSSMNQGDTFSGYIVPFLTKVEDSGQLLEGHDLTSDTSGWETDRSSLDFSDSSAVFVADGAQSRIYVNASIFSSIPGNVYAVFMNVKSDDVSQIVVGEVGGGSVTCTISSTDRRYGILYTSRSAQTLSIVSPQAGTIRISNVKLVKVTDTSSSNSFATLDEPRLELPTDSFLL